MNHSIRQAYPDDLAAVERIARRAYVLYVPRIGRVPAPMVADFSAQIAAGQVWVVGDPPLGFAVAYLRGDHWHLESVAVAPEAQGAGLGSALIARVEAMARAAGAAAVELYTNVKMTENQRLYPRLGYTETGRGIQDGFERVFYRKLLRDQGQETR